MLKYWRIWILLVILVASTLAIGAKTYPYGREGVEVVYVSADSPAKNLIQTGMVISEINGKPVTSVQEWASLASAAKGTVSLTANLRPYTLDLGNSSLGIEVKALERTNLDLGLDLQGGTRIILSPEGNATKENIATTISILQTRANLFGLQEIHFTQITDVSGRGFIQVEAAGVGREVVTDLLSKQGNFVAKIVKPVDLIAGKGTLTLGDKSYEVVASGESATVSGVSYEVDDNFTLQGTGPIFLEYANISSGRAYFLATAYTGKDVELVHTDPQRSGIAPSAGGYTFFFTASISQEGAQRFADITKGIPRSVDLDTGEEYLDSSIILYLDNEPVSDLRISAALAGEVVTEPQITGGRETQEEAIAERLQLQTILRSGSLPVKLSVASVDVISPTLGSDFFESAGLAAVLAGVLVVVIVFIRYRSIRLSLPMVFISFTEIVTIIGLSTQREATWPIWLSALAINLAIISLAAMKKQEIDIYAWAGAILIPVIGLSFSWTIDLAAIAGIVAAIGTSVDHQIIIADEAVRGGIRNKILTMKEKIKQAFFIIFGAAATQIAAMIPLIILGIGLVRGFAITTIIGVLVGILVTRPAYSRLVEIFYKEKG